MADAGSRQGSKQRHDSHERQGSKERSGSKEPMERQGSKERGHSKRASMREEENPPKKVPHDDNTWFASFSADAELLVSASGWERGNAIVFDVATMDELLRIPHK